MNYDDFLKNKLINTPASGLDEIPVLNKFLFPFQRDIVEWALRRGRAAIFADCGMGKTIMQLEWADKIPGQVLILAPLAVTNQTVDEGKRFGIDVNYARNMADAKGKITITNYEMLEHFEPSEFNGIVLDESSILKSYTGKFRNHIISSFGKTPYRLACTATPAPNDFMELGNHSEFLGVMNRTEMLAMFFIHDGGETQKWRLKGHGQKEYWKWICSWAFMIKNPSDLGYEQDGFTLPELSLHQHIVDGGIAEGYLFPLPAATLQERISARRNSVSERSAQIANIINGSNDTWLIWCNLNKEADEIEKNIDGAVQIKGSDDLEFKKNTMLNFAAGKIRILATKPSIAGFGMNWQVCHKVAFLGLSDSYEQFYQAIRRCWRFGQKYPVDCYIVISSQEGAVLENIKRKEKDAEKMGKMMIENMKDIEMENIKGTKRDEAVYAVAVESGEGWEMKLGDCVETLKDIHDDSIHYSIFSPPFASLYTYSNSERDMGNSKDHKEFFEHFKFMIAELYRVIMPGRLVSFHCMNLPTSKSNHGHIGIRDFRGDLIRAFEKEGFYYHSEVCIWKDPVTAMQRTKALGLLHKQIKKDACMSRQGIPDYLVTMRKPGENPERVTNSNETFPVSIWQQYASPIWMDINPSDTLQFRSARENNDERHICPLQLEVIKRAIRLWTNEANTILSPFAGIGSEGYVSVKMERKFIGIELKKSYFDVAVKNLKCAEREAKEKYLIAV